MKYRNLMIQGTASDVGKSVLVAGLCRVLYEDGVRVAPFKSQNMSLNSFITEKGKEMGRAQVVQAEAACTVPRCEMNPILMKPTGDKDAQIILNGDVLGDLSAIDYDSIKKGLKSKIKEIYNTLDDDYECIILEGAGSPAEINLRENDIVNMGMAEIVDSPVVLVGDIDKGGVFASIYGTLMLLSKEERERVKGVIINKFRGDIKLLETGLKMLEDLIEIPVLGVVPYFRLAIDEEDAISDRLKEVKKIQKGQLNVKIIALNYMSNFTDFNPLFSRNDINVSYATKREELEHADIIIIPGSKNTIKDLTYLKEYGFIDSIKEEAYKGKYIFGICGGMQILGNKIINKYHKECDIDEISGIGLLDFDTDFKEDKVMTQVKGEIQCGVNSKREWHGISIEGYEIHIGTTINIGRMVEPFIKIDKTLGKDDFRIEGYKNRELNVFGTYIHGIFDSVEFVNKIVKTVKDEKGIKEEYIEMQEFSKDGEYTKLANILRDSLDLEKIYKIINKESVERNYK